MIDRFFAYNNVLYDNIYAENLTEQEVNYFEGEIKFMFSQFYEAKYGKNMDDDLVMLYLLDYDNFIGKFKEQFNIEMEEDLLYYAFKCDYVGNIFGPKDLNKGYIQASVPVEAKRNIFDCLTFEEAIKEGLVEMHEDGTYTVVPTMYKQDENGMFYREEFIYSDEVNNYIIDDNNRNLSEGMNR